MQLPEGTVIASDLKLTVKTADIQQMIEKFDNVIFVVKDDGGNEAEFSLKKGLSLSISSVICYVIFVGLLKFGKGLTLRTINAYSVEMAVEEALASISRSDRQFFKTAYFQLMKPVSCASNVHYTKDWIIFVRQTRTRNGKTKLILSLKTGL